MLFANLVDVSLSTYVECNSLVRGRAVARELSPSDATAVTRGPQGTTYVGLVGTFVEPCKALGRLRFPVGKPQLVAHFDTLLVLLLGHAGFA